MKDKVVLINSKIRIPQPRKNYIVRDQLFKQLDLYKNNKVTLLKSGAGTGKTTLLASYIKERNLNNVVWLSIDETINNSFLFWRYLVEALGDYLDDYKEELLRLFTINIQKSNMEIIINLLINSLLDKEDIIIVLDDFYFLTDESLIKDIEYFINNTSENIHIFIITRYETKVYLTNLLMEDNLNIILEEEFKINNEEVKAFIENTLKSSFSKEELEAIDKAAEGWIGGVQLLAASSKIKGTNSSILKMKNSPLGEYLKKEIFSSLSKDEQVFLIITSILDSFSEEITKKLLPHINFVSVMDSLISKNILINIVNENEGIYRYHNILKDFLREAFNSLDIEEQRMYRKIAAKALIDIGEINEGLTQLLVCGEYKDGMELILSVKEGYQFFSYAKLIPFETIIKNYDFAYQFYFYCYINGEFDTLHKLISLIELENNELSEPFKLAEIFVGKNLNFKEVKILTIEEIDELPIAKATKTIIYIIYACLLWTEHRHEEAKSYISISEELGKNSVDPYILFYNFIVKSQILEDLGEFTEARKLYEKMENLKGGLASLATISVSYYIGIAGIHLKQMNLVAAKAALDKCEATFTKENLFIDRGYLYNLCEYKFLNNEIEEGLEIFNRFMEDEAFNSPIYFTNLIKYIINLNNPPYQYINKYKEAYLNTEPSTLNLDSTILYADILKNEGREEEALNIVEPLLISYRKSGLKLKIIIAALSKINIIGVKSSGDIREVSDLFKEALFYSYVEGILQPFYYYREIVQKVIKEIGPSIEEKLTSKEMEHYKNILALMKISPKGILSDRELEVLSEMAKGLSNKEIAEALCVSVATVKTHLINIFGKLEVGNRVQAVEVGRREGFI